MSRRTTRRPGASTDPVATTTPEMPWTHLALAIAGLLVLLVGVSYLAIPRREGSEYTAMPQACVRAYAAVPTPADSNLADAVIPDRLAARRTTTENCGFYRGLARLQAARAAQGARPQPAPSP
jgi:hypothetical protein